MRLFTCLFLAIASLSYAAPLPPPTGHVNDFAGILSEPIKSQLEQKLRAYKETSSNEICVVTVKSLEGTSVEDFTNRLARQWGVGNKKKDNGIVFLTAPVERKTRIEVGYKLEPILTDLQAKRIIENVIIPKFKAGRMPDGIEAGVEAIIAVLTPPPPPAPGEAPPPQPTKKDDVPKALIIVVLCLGGIGVVVAIIMAMQSKSESSWSSDSLDSDRPSPPSPRELSSLGTGAVIGGILGSSSRHDDDNESSSASSFHFSDSSGSFDGFGGGSFGGGGASGSW